jgi:hypothetical protein
MASSDHLKPGEKGRIEATVDTAGRAGKLAKTVQVLSNDPARPSVTLRLNAVVNQPPKQPPH